MSRASSRWFVVLLAAGTLRVPVAAQQRAALESVLDSLDRYLSAYAVRLPATVASEHYVQVSQNGGKSTETSLESDFAVVRLSGVKPWLGFRDVLRVDGRPVGRDLTAELFSAPTADTEILAHRMTAESTRYNLGPIERTINNPALVLELLDGRNRRRMRFTKEREDNVDGVPAWVVRFEEHARPTIIRAANSNRDVPVKGRAWIDSSTGTLMRAEVEVTSALPPRSRFQGNLILTFKLEPRLEFWVPARLVESYRSAAGNIVSSGDALYDNYRQFGVTARIIH